MHKVVVVGSAVADVILKSSGLHMMKSHQVQGGVALCEVLGGKIEAEEGILVSGGGGTNVAVGLHRLGEAVRVVCRVGDDDLGALLVKELEKENIDLSFLQRAKGRTGLSTVLVTAEGSRSIITYRGEAGEIEKKEIDWDGLGRADWIQISSLGGDFELLDDLVAFAVDRGIRIGLNPGKKELVEKEKIIRLLPKLDFFNVNRMEAAELCGEVFEKEKNLIKRLTEMGCRLVMMTDGKRGASLIEKGRWIKMEAYPDRSVDDTGAGDAFVSGAVAGLLQNKSLGEVLQMGLANGAGAVSKLGAKEGLLSPEQMERRLKKKLKAVEESLYVL